MKNLFQILAMAALFVFYSCSKEIISESDTHPALDLVNADTAAKNWKPVLLSAPDEFPVVPPSPVSSADYLAEANEVIGWQSNITARQQEIVDYWNAGGVLRWNEILRELVAKHNLPPYQNEDGTYPVPNAANPFSYPQFPFSNPPFAARAYAYVSAAQYDALIAASFYRNLYKRKSPGELNNSIRLMVPRSQIEGYAYPSEEAVIDGVTVEMLKLLFPTEIAFVQQKADEHKLSRIISGASTRSDIEAGEKLGKAVASKFITRARGDRAGQAGGNAALWISMEQQCVDKGEIPWKSLESPSRPPMLPRFGVVKGFLLDSISVINGRPAAPPSTGSDEFKKDVEEVLWYSQHPTKEHYKLVDFWADGAGTYTPPGHWNAIACDAFIGRNYSEARWARNLALLNLAMMDAAICCWDVKFTYFNPRPSQINPEIKTLTGLPNFPSFPSGHSTFSGAAATILSHLIPALADTFNEYANEASMSRLYGGIHYRRDCETGLIMGKAIGQKAVMRAMSDGAE
ncbi:MAG TPA: phosphatase PAP2 family protein [Lentimicrobium sp.]|nr:phosphatase PAP2 family protein [Lentimicrobium sp.]